jgi:hypothetical protein
MVRIRDAKAARLDRKCAAIVACRADDFDRREADELALSARLRILDARHAPHAASAVETAKAKFEAALPVDATAPDRLWIFLVAGLLHVARFPSVGAIAARQKFGCNSFDNQDAHPAASVAPEGQEQRRKKRPRLYCYQVCPLAEQARFIRH